MTTLQSTLTSILSACAALYGSAAEAASCKLTDLGWMKGVWRTDSATENGEERWTIAPNGRLMGSAWFLRTDGPGGVVEAITIQQDGVAVAMRLRHFNSTLALAREEKDAPMIFIAVQCNASSVVFDGQGAQKGGHMTYRREGNHLTFIGDFIHHGERVRDEVKFKKYGE
ncbi:MAG TPA: DUF6265 family protein [Burkholderiaceae bacterium]|nr:DUF6265 family protein [Burkholderiaceae bacterium]